MGLSELGQQGTLRRGVCSSSLEKLLFLTGGVSPGVAMPTVTVFLTSGGEASAFVLPVNT